MTSRASRSGDTQQKSDSAMDIVPVRHPGRWVSVAIALLLLAMLAHAVVTESGFGWRVVGDYITEGAVLSGLARTLELTALAMVIGICGGIILAACRLSPDPILRVISSVYVWVFRGTPLLVQLILWFNLSSLLHHITIGVPFGPSFVNVGTNDVITPLVAALLGLGLNEAAYMAEIVRGGILSIDGGQHDAARAIGMSRTKTLRHVVLPQAMRAILPPIGNEVVGMLKYTSLVSVVGFTELLLSVENIYTRTFQTIPLLLVASIWYLIATTAITLIQRFVEQYFGRGQTPLKSGGGRRRLITKLRYFRAHDATVSAR